MPQSATMSPRSWLRSTGVSASSCPRRSSAATAIASSSSRPLVAERLVIGRLGHRGDGVADGADGGFYVPGALRGETVEVEKVGGHPDRRRLVRVEAASAARIAPICQHFGVCGGCAVQHWDPVQYRAWERDLVVAALRQGAGGAPGGEMIHAPGA